MANITITTIPTPTLSADTAGEQFGAKRNLIISYNGLLNSLAALGFALTSDGIIRGTALSRGTTVTLASSACTITIGGVPVVVAATTAQAFGALGTIPASKWGIIGVDMVAAGTLSFVSGAANYTTGYASEALAIAAVPAKTANKARAGYITILASASTWVAGTDALTGGTGGNPATTTNYYNIASPFDLATDSANAITLGSRAWTATQITNVANTVITV